ncbi:MAG: 5-oxoprolinase subunit PxpB [Actinobacteria bacterium]|nr:MAG: 5-oxoprolinase subunit PxpB [Actinomycetota bacterium]
MLRSFDGSTAEANAAARALSDEVTAARFTEVADVVPGARTVLVELVPGIEPSAALVRALEADAAQPRRGAGRRHEIAVTYDGEDLAEVAASRRLLPRDVVELHSEAEYTVAFIGFQPGFPYLLGLPAELAVRRLASPRVKVPAGSVAIAGEYSGIYPGATPGGWRLIGRTETVLFDAENTPPSILQPGDMVRFVPA